VEGDPARAREARLNFADWDQVGVCRTAM
jgi:hypothetical protein